MTPYLLNTFRNILCVYDMAAEVQPVPLGVGKVIIFTDPVISGKYGLYSASGDADDLGAIPPLASTYKDRALFVICDCDADGGQPFRFDHFMGQYGGAFTARFGCQFIKEDALADEHFVPNTCIVYHSPVEVETTETVRRNARHVSRLYTQGSAAGDTNFKKGNFFPLLAELQGGGTYVYSSSTASTRVDCVVDPAFRERLTNPVSQELYDEFPKFLARKTLGVALGPPLPAGLTGRLYSDTQGMGGGRGTNWDQFYNAVQVLRAIPQNEGGMPPREGLQDATLAQIQAVYTERCRTAGIPEDPTVVPNMRDIFWCLNQYCDYDGIRGVTIPTMATLPAQIDVKPDCPEVIVACLEGKTNFLFDVVAAGRVIGAFGSATPTSADVKAFLERYILEFDTPSATSAFDAGRERPTAVVQRYEDERGSKRIGIGGRTRRLKKGQRKTHKKRKPTKRKRHPKRKTRR
jgi:hypothetical protein